MRELEQAVGADACALLQALTVDVERRAVKQLIRVPDADGPQSTDVVIGDSVEVLKSPVHE